MAATTSTQDNQDTSSSYQSARSRTSSVASEGRRASLQTLGDQPVSVSSNAKRQHKDKRVYINPRTGLPVRPPTSFALFKHALRRSMKGGKVGFQEFNKKAVEAWAKLDEEQKLRFTVRARILSEHFKKIEVACLRKKVKQLQSQVKEYRQSVRSLDRSGSSRRGRQ